VRAGGQTTIGAKEGKLASTKETYGAVVSNVRWFMITSTYSCILYCGFGKPKEGDRCGNERQHCYIVSEKGRHCISEADT